MRKTLLVLILTLSTFLRLYQISEYPALNADEAAIGYNAHSLIETGRDEHGNAWPIHFQSFNDYKPGLYVYMTLPFVYVLGLNEFSVRIASVLIGIISVAVFYLFVSELVKSGFGITSLLGTKYKKYDYWLPVVAPLFLAFSPWHIHFSRGAWEVNVASFFILLGTLLFLKGLKDPKFFILCVLSFAISLYTYHAARVVVPLLIVLIFLAGATKLKKHFKTLVLAGVVGLVILMPLALDLTGGSVFSRAAGVGVFSDLGPQNRINQQRGEHADYRSMTAKVLHNKPVNYTLAILENWSDHFWGEFLFLSGDDIERNKVPETGQMHMIDVLFVMFGVLFAIRVLRNGKGSARFSAKLIIVWLVIAPVAAALTFQSPHALRSHNMLYPLIILSSYGAAYLISLISMKFVNKVIIFAVLTVISLAVVWSFARYYHMYFAHMAVEYPFSSQYGVKELVEFVDEAGNDYEHIVVSDIYDQPYILFLFYMKYPPEKFQIDHELTPRDKYGFSTVRSFGKYRFEPIEWDVIRAKYPNSLIAGADEEIPDEANVVKNIYGTNGYKYFQVVGN